MYVGIANTRWRGKRPRQSHRMRNQQFYVSGKRPILPSLSADDLALCWRLANVSIWFVHNNPLSIWSSLMNKDRVSRDVAVLKFDKYSWGRIYWRTREKFGSWPVSLPFHIHRFLRNAYEMSNVLFACKINNTHLKIVYHCRFTSFLSAFHQLYLYIYHI